MQPIFSRNKDIDRIAFLNWRMSKDNDILNLTNIAEGYLEAGIKLAKLSLISNKDKTADIVIFPILMNVNHGIELYLKAINWMLNDIMGLNERIAGKHNIKQLYETVRSKIRSYQGGVSAEAFADATLDLWAYLVELFDKINATEREHKMDFSRYPFDNNYRKHFYVDCMGNVEVDLENFVYRFEKILLGLDNIAEFLYYHEMTEEE